MNPSPGMNEMAVSETATAEGGTHWWLLAAPLPTPLAWLLCLIVLAAVILFGNSELVRGKAAPIWDALDYYAPFFSLVADHVRSGHLLLWNPWINGGSPDCVDPQSGASSPIIMLLGLLWPDPFQGFIAYWMLLWLFGGAGMLLLCRHLGAPRWGALIAALGFISCGFYTGHGEHTSALYSFSFIPWMLWRFDLGLLRRSWWNIVEASVLWGVSALGGYPALTILDPMFLSLWGLGRAFTAETGSSTSLRDSRRNALLFAIASIVLLGAIGSALMSPAYLGFFKYAQGYTVRVSRLGQISGEGALPPALFSTVTNPYLYLLNWSPYKLWPETDVSMSNIYMGALVLPLAFLAILKGNRWRLWLGFIVVLFMCCAVGDHLPVRHWVFELVPPTQYFRFPSLFSAYGIVGMCVLAALGTADLNETRSDARRLRLRFFVITAVTAAAATVVYLWMLRIAHVSAYDSRRPSHIFATIWILAVVVSFLWWRGLLNKRVVVVCLLATAMFDAATAIRISRRTLYTRDLKPVWELMSARHIRRLDLTPNGLNRQLYASLGLVPKQQQDRNLPLKEVTLANDTGLGNPFFSQTVADEVLNRIALGPQRIWFSATPVWLPPNSGTFLAYIAESHHYGLPPLVLHTPAQMLQTSHLLPSTADENSIQWRGPLTPAPIDLISYFPNTLAFNYEAAEDGWLLVTDRWAPGWTAEVNGTPVEVLGGNFLFRAVAVKRGHNMIVFHYQPRGYLVMIAISWSLLTLFIIGEVWRLTLWRRRGQQVQER